MIACGDGASLEPEPEPEPEPTGCEAGSLEQADGSCLEAGIPADQCAAGFAADGLAGCVAILPPEPCGAGTLALPGETACREVADCGEGPWGLAPLSADTQHVDRSYAGGDSDGSAERPWISIQQGVDAATAGGLVAIAAGTYGEDLRISGKPVVLWGRCPSMTEIDGTGAAPATVLVANDAAGTEIRSLAVTGPRFGIASSGSLDVRVEQVWVHDTHSRGVIVENTFGDSSLQVRGSLIEGAWEIGAMAYGASLTLESTVVRDTQLGSSSGRGVVVRLGSSATIQSCLIERNRDHAVMISGSTATIADSLLRDTAPGPGQQFGGGLVVRRDDDSQEPSTVSLSGSVLERNHYYGVLVEGSTADVERTVVRDTFPQQLDQSAGVGLQAQFDLDPALVTIRQSVFERNHYGAVSIMASTGHLESVIARDTIPDPVSGEFGRGVMVFYDRELGVPAVGTLLGSVIERNTEAAIFVAASELTVDRTVARDTAHRADGHAGRGISVQSQDDLAMPSTATILSSLVERNYQTGILVEGSMATIEATTIRETWQEAAGGIYGDSLVVMTSMSVGQISTATLVDCSLEDSPRAGIANFGGLVILRDNALTCNAIDLNGQSSELFPYEFDDQGGNGCSCEQSSADCRVMTNELQPPVPVGVP